jgi:phenylpropionate dioxygenase-like ring-hydroxylating dioxygenase large terminal subunit
MTKFLKNCWYVAAWTHEVTQDQWLARTLAGVPVLLWRDGNHNLIAFEDRCCHRGAPLSAGRREADSIRCMYHGLRFDKSGACIEIPSQTFIPPQAKVRSFPAVERSKWIWVWLGDPANADTGTVPDTHYLDDPGWRGVPGYMHYDANYLLIADNILDFSHLSYVHEKTLGGSARYAEILPKVTRLAQGIHVERWLIDDAPAPFLQGLGSWPGNVDRWNIYHFLVPGVMLMDSGSAATGTGAPEGNRVNAAQFFGCQAITPETEYTSHYFFQQSHGFSLDNPEVTARLTQSVLIGFEEDRRIIEAQQRSLRLDPAFPMIGLRMDSALGVFRGMMERLIAAE